ncbi:MAG: hypothetical protein K0B37_15515 [Bacteroidales bacterium]|nr:hypothetical protein [Bacteroidales bacterium]
MKSTLIIFVSFLLLVFDFKEAYCQRDPALVVAHPDRKKEGFFYLSDSVIASELASFNFVGRIYRQKPSEPLISFPVESVSSNSVEFAYENHTVFIETGRFRPSRHHLKYYRMSGYLHKIDGRYFWGIDGKVPQRQIETFKVVIDEIPINIPLNAYNDIFEPNLCIRMVFSGTIRCNTAVYISHEGERIYIHMRNGEIPSLYEVTWVFRHGKYLGRVVDFAY